MSKNITIAAAYEFLRRGYVGEQLQIEIANFTNWLSVRAAEGNPIKYPKVILKNWTTKTDNNAAPNETEDIANFMLVIKCADIDAICAIDRFSVVGNTLVIILRRNMQHRRDYAGVIDEFVMRNVTAAREFIKRRFNAVNLEYRYEQ